MKLPFNIVIPARYKSQRLPGKPLADIAGQTMIERVWHQACRSSAREIVIATDDVRIIEAARAFGAEVEMTFADHRSGTDRLAEIAGRRRWPQETIVVNVQGDEPMLPPVVIDQVAELLHARPLAMAATLCEPLTRWKDCNNPSNVKVIFDDAGYAMYFSRAPIPWQHRVYPLAESAPLSKSTHCYRHIGLYAYRAGLLAQFGSWPRSELERTEDLEQLRLLSRGQRIAIAIATAPVPGSVDTQEDLDTVRILLAPEWNRKPS